MVKTLTLAEIARAIGAEYDGPGSVSGVSTDSRSVQPGELFVAIVGDNMDGHKYLDMAFDNGAVAAVISDAGAAVEGKPCLLCSDTKDAMIQIGGLYRSKFTVRCVGVTGSVGKTTTKEMIYAVLNQFGKTLKNEGNQNNEIGMPRTLFALEEDTEMAVIEMGMDGPGQIAPMTRAVCPEVAVITNIGVSHMEALGSRENIYKEKLSIAEGLTGMKTLVINADDEYLSKTERHPDVERTLRISTEGAAADLTAEEIETVGEETRFTVCCEEARYPAVIPCLGKHNVVNALVALAVSTCFGFDTKKAIAGLRDYRPAGMRQRVKKLGGITVIEDCYNASPDSMEASISLLGKNFPGSRKIAVLADMLELGEESDKMHLDVGDKLVKRGVDIALCYGDRAKLIARRAKEGGVDARFFSQKEEMTAVLCDLVRPGDCILIKGSRGMKLEEVLSALYAHMQ